MTQALPTVTCPNPKCAHSWVPRKTLNPRWCPACGKRLWKLRGVPSNGSKPRVR